MGRITDNLISYWNLSESSGTRVDSVRKTGNDLTDILVPTLNLGPNNFNRSNQFTVATANYLTRPDNTSLRVGDGNFTFTLHVYLDAVNISQVAIGKDVENARDYTIDFSSNVLRFYINGGGIKSVNSSVNILAATWYFIVASNDSSNQVISLLVNNTTLDKVSTTGGGTTTVSNSSLEIGRRTFSTNHDNFGGRIARVGFWKRLLTTAEKAWLYNNGYGRSYYELVDRSLVNKFAGRRGYGVGPSIVGLTESLNDDINA